MGRRSKETLVLNNDDSLSMVMRLFIAMYTVLLGLIALIILYLIISEELGTIGKWTN
jgi:hypothetical protein